MYSIVKSIGVKFGINQRWGEINLEEYTVVQLYNTFRRCYVRLSAGSPVVYYDLDLDGLKLQYSTYAGSFSSLLTLIGNTTLPIVTNMPVINTVTAKYKDIFQIGFKATPVSPLYGVSCPVEDRTSVILTRDHPVTDYARLYKRAMVTVGGFYHLTDTNGANGLVVYDAVKSLRVSNQNQIGILSFESVAEIKMVPITSQMVKKQDFYEPYSSTAYIHLDMDLTGKSVMIVIGGYLNMIDDKLITKVGLSDFKIDFKNYSLLDRYYESMHYLDLSSLGLSPVNSDKLQTSTEEFLSDSAIVKYLTLSQSFLVIVDTPELFANKQYIRRSNMYGMYVAYKKPVYPLAVGLGRHPEYLSVFEDRQWAITVNDNTVENKIYNTINPVNLVSTNSSDTPQRPVNFSAAYFLEIGKDI